MNLKREVWIDLLVGKDNEHLYDNDWFLERGINLDSLVENNVINFTHKGTIPGVIKNPTYPLNTVTRTDLPDFIALAPYASERFQLPKIDLHALPYDKRATVLVDHRESIFNELVSEGIWNTSPFDNSNPLTPTVDATGAADENGNKLVTIADILALRKKLNIAYPKLKKAAWTLVLDTNSYYNVANDIIIRAQQQQQGKIGDVNVTTLKIHGFELIEDGRTAYYDGTSNERIPYGASPALGTDHHSAIAFVNNKTYGKAVGTVDFFDDPKDSEYQADFGSFLIHSYIGPLSNDLETNLRYMGAILRKV